MGIIQRKDSPYWWISYTDAKGQRIRESTQIERAGKKSKELAAHLLNTKEQEVWKQKHLNAKPTYYWEDAVLNYLKSVSMKEKTRTNVESIFAWLDPYLKRKPLHMITRKYIEEIAQIKETQCKRERFGGCQEICTLKQKQGYCVSKSTVNTVLNKIRMVLRKARNEWEWIDQVPSIKLRKESRRDRWESPEILGKLKEKLPRHQYLAMLFALATGLRKTNVSLHEKAWIDRQQKITTIPGIYYKNREPHTVVLNEVALWVIDQVWNDHDKYLFTYRPAPIGKPDYKAPIKELNTKAWRTALKECGIENFRQHDLRHTWASWMAQNGASLLEIMESGGWKDLRSVKRYSHLAKENLRAVSDRLSDTKLARLMLDEDKENTLSG